MLFAPRSNRLFASWALTSYQICYNFAIFSYFYPGTKFEETAKKLASIWRVSTFIFRLFYVLVFDLWTNKYHRTTLLTPFNNIRTSRTMTVIYLVLKICHNIGEFLGDIDYRDGWWGARSEEHFEDRAKLHRNRVFLWVILLKEGPS